MKNEEEEAPNINFWARFEMESFISKIDLDFLHAKIKLLLTKNINDKR
jgi:hypothetical protein